MANRACLTCGRPFEPRTYNQRRCEQHEQRGRQSRSPTTRAQDAEYQRNRAVLLADNPPCIYCGAPATQADHVVPVALGGTHEFSNLAPACAHCNASKGARLAPKPAVAQGGPVDHGPNDGGAVRAGRFREENRSVGFGDGWRSDARAGWTEVCKWRELHELNGRRLV